MTFMLNFAVDILSLLILLRLFLLSLDISAIRLAHKELPYHMLLYTNAFTVSRENGFVNYDFQQLNRNARITTIFEFVDKLNLTYFVWYFTLVITNFSAPFRL